MAKYYVNNNDQPNGDNEVHKEGCIYMPDVESRVYLGDLSNCTEAVHEAKKYYSQVNGCKTCSRECHTQ